MAQIEVVKPNRDGTFPEARLIVTDVNASVVFDLRGDDWQYMTIQMIARGAIDLTSLVNKVRISNDGSNPVDFPAGAVTLSAVGITTALTVTAINFLHVTFTTAGTSGTVAFLARASRARSI